MSKKLDFVNTLKLDGITPSGKGDGISFLTYSTKIYIFVPVQDNFLEQATPKDREFALEAAKFSAMEVIHGEAINELVALKNSIPERHHAKVNSTIRSLQYQPKAKKKSTAKAKK